MLNIPATSCKPPPTTTERPTYPKVNPPPCFHHVVTCLSRGTAPMASAMSAPQKQMAAACPA